MLRDVFEVGIGEFFHGMAIDPLDVLHSTHSDFHGCFTTSKRQVLHGVLAANE